MVTLLRMTDRLPPIAAQRARNTSIREHAERVAHAFDGSVGADARPVIVVPANTRETTLLPERTRSQFLARVAGTIQRVLAIGVSGATVPATAEQTAALADATPFDAPTEDASLVGFTCATCRGECCTAGGDHAFLRDDSIARVRAQHPALSESDLLGLYAEHLPVRHYRGSCVYHTTTGCALPRTLRSNLCNRYVCGGVTQLRHALTESGGAQVFVGAADSVHLRRMALIDAQEARPIPLT